MCIRDRHGRDRRAGRNPAVVVCLCARCWRSMMSSSNLSCEEPPMNACDATLSFVPRTPATRVTCLLALLLLATVAAVAAETAIPLSQAQFGGQCAEGLATGRHVM